ncbi:unnamed protein product [Didymodactylos carnosus]|uniref:ATPase inhibitor, mitochondrial n=1 Tax=Didymodactylos carnosus TaxID=1234261 RepID=A0A815ZXH3_9BILA|nr:unnamed protein product [Didymodactylos carnosus]CAF1590338.1 unnamed protein product [Didymodactylos carnosus]CAF3681833.1 unnamed protein product [Didymodactylos carnosus]CAF4461959.1 unnamed protein product [Didymodactylos carnosus]
MLRTSSFTLTVFRYPLLQQIIRFSSTDATAGSINAGHDKFAEREQALENQYFRKQSEELIKNLQTKHDDLSRRTQDLTREQKELRDEIAKLEGWWKPKQPASSTQTKQ